MDDDRDNPKTHPYTDHRLDHELSALSGSDVVLSGRKADGTPFQERTLGNVSFVPKGSGRVFVIGMDPAVGSVRQFDLGGIDRMESNGLVYDRARVTAMLDRAVQRLRERSSSSEGARKP